MAVDVWATNGLLYRELDHAPSVELDGRSPSMVLIILLGDMALTTVNLVRGNSILLILRADAGPYSLTFPSSWKWLGEVPVNFGLGFCKIRLSFFGTDDSGVMAAWEHPTSYSSGMPEGVGTTGQNNAVVTIGPGQPVAVANAGGFLRASAATAGAAAVGLAFGTAAPSAALPVLLDGSLSLTDWTVPTGAANLLVRSDYFLDVVAGKLTPVPPAVVGQVVQRIGTALSPCRMEIKIQPSIML